MMQENKVLCGADVLAQGEIILQGRCGLITNPTGVLKDFTSTIDMLKDKCDLVALFAAEHGIRGDKQASAKVENYIDERTGLKVYSLYEDDTKARKQIKALDTLIYDIQDVGARFYTYAYTLTDTMKFCAEHGVNFVVLDRPNMLGGKVVEGTLLETEFSSFVGRFPTPTRSALTIGEFASMMNDTEELGCDLTVVKMQGWKRDMYFDQTGLSFIAPSPNIPTLETAFLYIGTCIFEGTNVCEGRGTTKPFEMIGAPWLDPQIIIDTVGESDGAVLRECHFTPTFSKYKDELCHGIQIHIIDREKFSAFEVGIKIFDALRKTHKEFEYNDFVYRLLGTKEIDAQDFDLHTFIATQKKKILTWQELSKKWYLY